MATTDVDICARALILLGADPIQSFDDETDEASTCGNLYGTVKEFVLSKYPWRFTVEKRQLARESASPQTRWKYQFKLPSDRLQDGPIAVYNDDGEGARPIANYEIAGTVLYADDTKIYIDYQTKVDEGGWPPYFVHLMVHAVAAHLANAITDQTTTTKFYMQMTFGTPEQQWMGGLMASAMSQNALESPPKNIDSGEFIRARSQ